MDNKITQVTNITLLRSAAIDRDRQQGLSDAQWRQCRNARRRLTMALACDPIENAGMRQVHIIAALAALGDLGAE